MNSYKAATADGFVIRPAGSFSAVHLGYDDIDRIEVGCSQVRGRKKRYKASTRYRYEIFFASGQRMELFSAWTPASRLGALEQVDAQAVANGVNIIHKNDISRNHRATQESADADCTQRIIKRYKHSNEVRAFKLLRLDNPYSS